MQSDQLALSPADSEAVRQLAQRTGRTEAALLHEAVEKLMQQVALENWRVALRGVKGMWADHPSAPNQDDLRAGWQSRTTGFEQPTHE
ncbi:MAG TPA: hypothetical protein VF630_18615 [Hymenobacter sp.]|jgi:malate synthase